MICLIKRILTILENRLCSFVKPAFFIVFLIILFSVSCNPFPKEEDQNTTSTSTTTTGTSERPPHGSVNFKKNSSNWLVFEQIGSYSIVRGEWKLVSPPCYAQDNYNTNLSLTDVNTVKYYLRTDKYPNGKVVGSTIIITIQKQGETKTIYY
jgi:hypothetical protein